VLKPNPACPIGAAGHRGKRRDHTRPLGPGQRPRPGKHNTRSNRYVVKSQQRRGSAVQAWPQSWNTIQGNPCVGGSPGRRLNGQNVRRQCRCISAAEFAWVSAPIARDNRNSYGQRRGTFARARKAGEVSLKICWCRHLGFDVTPHRSKILGQQ
jgi:hypothetical protein